MLDIYIISVGKIKEKFMREATEEYIKRLGRFCSVNPIEVKDEPIPERCSEKEKQALLKKEGERILGKIPKGAYVISLCVEGKSMTSEEFARMLESLPREGAGKIAFVIGGSLGLSEEVKAASRLRLSFSEMTFPHQLMRVILTEQIYRAFTIAKGITYHK